MKRLGTVQDISCLGKCSITVALPVLAAMGIECALLPTALLSTHTGFPGNTYRDLTEELLPIARHWRELGVELHGISTGYLANAAQCQMAEEISALFPGAPLFVDPVMGDHGRLYRGLSPELPRAMGRLCARAAVILPNLTEAALLTGRPYPEVREEARWGAVLEDLLALGCGSVVLTGLEREGQIGVAVAIRGQAPTFRFAPRVPKTFHGTGDIFSAVTVGEFLRGAPLEEAAQSAADFVAACLRAADPSREPYGVPFEACLPMLWEKQQRGGGERPKNFPRG